MSSDQSHTFYTFVVGKHDAGDRWHNDGHDGPFFETEGEAREAILDFFDVRKVEDKVEDGPPPPMQLEKIVTVPITREALLALFNNGVGAIVQHYEIIETIDGGR